MLNAIQPIRHQFGHLIPNLKHWEFAERKRIELRAVLKSGDHAKASRLARDIRINFDAR